MRQVYSCIRSDRRSGLAGGNRQLQSFKSNPPTLPRASFNPHSDRRPEAPQWINTTTTIGQWSKKCLSSGSYRTANGGRAQDACRVAVAGENVGPSHQSLCEHAYCIQY